MDENHTPTPPYNGKSFKQMLEEHDAQQRKLKELTPENCSYLDASVIRYAREDGVQKDFISYLEVNHAWAMNAIEPDNYKPPTRFLKNKDNVDNIVIFPEREEDLFSVQHAATRFFVTNSGHICCYVEGSGSTSGDLLV